MGDNKSDEQRKHKRYVPVNDTFAALRGHISKVGQIIDISKGGLAFRYIDIGERPTNSFDLDIFLSDNGFYLQNIPYKNVTDLEIANEFPYSTTKMRRRGIQFETLTKDHITRLEYFLENHSRGAV